MTEKSILAEALELVNGPRQKNYDHPSRNFKRIADAYNALHLGEPVLMTPEKVAIFMILKKLSRHIHSPKRDNLVDIAGYAETLARLMEPMETGFRQISMPLDLTQIPVKY